jgi:hypothetical protein
MMAKPWWDTATSRRFGFKGIATRIIAKRIAYLGWRIPANDRDDKWW